jgi:hypothetical protein
MVSFAFFRDITFLSHCGSGVDSQMSTWNISWVGGGDKLPVRQADKSGHLNLLEPPGSVRACTGIALLFLTLLVWGQWPLGSCMIEANSICIWRFNNTNANVIVFQVLWKHYIQAWKNKLFVLHFDMMRLGSIINDGQVIRITFLFGSSQRYALAEVTFNTHAKGFF